jgi:hypothetical protein
MQARAHNLKITQKMTGNENMMNRNVSRERRNDPNVVPTVAQEDLELMAAWTRNELFKKKKFIFNAKEELKLRGNLYCHFANDCKKRLVGIRRFGDSQENKRMYLDMLWKEGTGKGRNIIAIGLQSKRSSVYSAMFNRFIGKPKQYSCYWRDDGNLTSCKRSV